MTLTVLAAFWITAGTALARFGMNGPATVLLCALTAVALPCATLLRRTGRARGAALARAAGARVPPALWAFAALAVVSAARQRTEAGVQNALVYLTFVCLTALAAAWASAGSALLMLRWIRAASLLTAAGYLVTVVLDGPGNSSLYPARIFGEIVWIGMVAAVPLAARSRWGFIAPLLLVTADLLSLSRTSTAVCALLFLGIAATGRRRGELRRLLLLAGVMACGALLLVTQYEPLRDRFIHNDNRGIAGVEIGTSGRSAMWRATWSAIKESPWTGHGIGTAQQLMATVDPTGGLHHPHNDYLRLWHDLGLVGLGLWVAAILTIGRGVYRRRRAARDDADWAIHQAALIALIGLSLNVVTSNLLVYVFVMAPIAVVIGTSMGLADRGTTHLKCSQKISTPKGYTLDLRGFLRVMARRWLSIGLLTLLGLGAGLSVAALSTPQYEASSQIFVSTRATSSLMELNQGSSFSQARVQSYADIVTSPRIAEAVIDRLRVDLTPRRLTEHLSADVKLNTVLIDIAFVDTDAERAARIANTVADEASRQIVSLETPPGEGAAPVHIGITRTATPPTQPISPRPLVDAVAGLLAGLLAGVGLSVLREVLDNTLRTSQALGEATGLPVLGAVPFDKGAPDHPLTIGPAAHGARAEAFRLVRTNLQFAQVDRRPRIIMVTSPLPGEGKTNTAANLALSLAETGSRICLVDADLRNPCIAKAFGLVQDAGLTSVLAGLATADEVMQQGGDGSLSVLASGPMPPNPAELLASERMREVLEDLARDFDTVVVDSAPLLPVADTVGLAPSVDGAVLVVRAGRTPAERVQAAAEALRSVGAPILGGVLSMARLQSQGYGYGYGYGQRSGGSEDRLVPPRKEGAEATAPEVGVGA